MSPFLNQLLEGTVSPLFVYSSLFMDVAEEIRQLTTQCLLNEHHFLVDVVVSSKRGPGKVLVILDSDQGIGIDDCAEISRRLAKLLDEAGIMDNYLLEVSTPGVDMPLKMTRQYQKNIGRNLKVKLKEETVEGTLMTVSENIITLSQIIGTGRKKETKSVEIPFSEIEKAFVLVSFK